MATAIGQTATRPAGTSRITRPGGIVVVKTTPESAIVTTPAAATVRLPTTTPCVAPDQAAGGVVRQRPPCDGKQPGGEDDTAKHDVEEVLGLRQVKDADLPGKRTAARSRTHGG
jgi:hypothetical protein